MPIPPNIPRRILIVGGGSAGWMSASLFLAAWGKLGVDISLVESPEIDTIGVGEGSTPLLTQVSGFRLGHNCQ